VQVAVSVMLEPTIGLTLLLLTEHEMLAGLPGACHTTFTTFGELLLELLLAVTT
jgi:hypothetical protein